MMQIVHCDNCGGSDIGLDSVSVSLDLRKSNFCDKCYHTHSQNTSYFFCSLPCFLEYMKKVADGKATVEFDRHKHNIVPVQIAK